MDLEAEAIGSVISERNIELEQARLTHNLDGMLGQPASRPSSRTGGATSPAFEAATIQQGTILVLF